MERWKSRARMTRARSAAGLTATPASCSLSSRSPHRSPRLAQTPYHRHAHPPGRSYTVRPNIPEQVLHVSEAIVTARISYIFSNPALGMARALTPCERRMTMSTRTRTLPLVTLPLLLVVTGATASAARSQSPVPETSRDRSHLRHDESRTRALMPSVRSVSVSACTPHTSPSSSSPSRRRPRRVEWASPDGPRRTHRPVPRSAADPDNPGWPGLGLRDRMGWITEEDDDAVTR